MEYMCQVTSDMQHTYVRLQGDRTVPCSDGEWSVPHLTGCTAQAEPQPVLQAVDGQRFLKTLYALSIFLSTQVPQPQ